MPVALLGPAGRLLAPAAPEAVAKRFPRARRSAPLLEAPWGAVEGGGAAARPGGASVSGGEAAAARYGTLSVYYLGGVGSVELDGAALPDPPLTGYRVRAGRHVLRCRLPRDAEPHTLEVIVEPGRETVVEYELGGRPRATIGETP